jgi:hypothetical protein
MSTLDDFLDQAQASPNGRRAAPRAAAVNSGSPPCFTVA